MSRTTNPNHSNTAINNNSPKFHIIAPSCDTTITTRRSPVFLVKRKDIMRHNLKTQRRDSVLRELSTKFNLVMVDTSRFSGDSQLNQFTKDLESVKRTLTWTQSHSLQLQVHQASKEFRQHFLESPSLRTQPLVRLHTWRSHHWGRVQTTLKLGNFRLRNWNRLKLIHLYLAKFP